MVLVLSPARLLAKRLAYRPICYEQCGVSKRVEYGGADHFFVTHGVVPRCRRRNVEQNGCAIADRLLGTALSDRTDAHVTLDRPLSAAGDASMRTLSLVTGDQAEHSWNLSGTFWKLCIQCTQATL